MPPPDIRKVDVFAPGYRSAPAMDITPGVEVVFPQPRTVRALADGVIAYRDSLGDEETTGTLTAGADVVGPGDGLVLIAAILAATTVTRIQTGIL